MDEGGRVRTLRRGFFALVWLWGVVSLRGDEWEELRGRPGNDDIYVMIDTSLSMAPSVGGPLANVKAFLQDLFARYVKDGDRVILMTFDADAHLHGIVPIVDRRRDVELLREVVDGIDVRRTIHYGGTWPDLTELRAGPWTGGGAAADYCEMWRLSSRVLQKYGEPSHRQLFLLFTGGPAEAPAYRPCNDPGAPSVVSLALREHRLRVGVVVLVSTSRALRELFHRMPAKVIEFRPIDDLRRDMLELLNERVDLAQPRSLFLGAHSTIDLHAPLMVVNRSAAEKTITIRNAILHLRDGAVLHIPVTPSKLTLHPRQSAIFTLARSGLFEIPGDYDGQLVFNFGAGDRFDPAVLAFSATKQTWFEARGRYATWIAVTLIVVLVLMLLWLTFQNTLAYAPATITAHYRGDPLARPCRDLQVGITAPFGGGGAVPGELFVNADAPAGGVFRAGPGDWLLAWDGARFEPYLPGMPAVPPGVRGQEWQFFMETNRRPTLAGLPAWLRSRFCPRSQP